MLNTTRPQPPAETRPQANLSPSQKRLVNTLAKLANQPPPPANACTLPPQGGDEYYGLSRSWWYNAEKLGHVRLTRVRLPGNRKARVLLSRESADACIAKLSQGNAAK